MDEHASNIIGWREWLALPSLGIPAIKAKIDTGAKTSALHTFKLEPFSKNSEDYIRFWIHPLRKRTDIEIVCEMPVKDQRVVRDSGGHREERYVIESLIKLGSKEWLAEITLTSREDMLFRMLLGRSALVGGGFSVDPGASYLAGKKSGKAYRKN